MPGPTYLKSKFPYVMSHSNSFRRHRWKKVLYREPWGIAGWAWWQALVMTCKESRESTSGRIQKGEDPVTKEEMEAIDCWEPPTQEFAEHLISAGWLKEDADGCLRIVDTETWLATPSSVPEYDSERRARNKAAEPSSAENPGECRSTVEQSRGSAEGCRSLKQAKLKQSNYNYKLNQSNAKQGGSGGTEPSGGDPPDPQGQALDAIAATGGDQDPLFTLQCEWTARHVPSASPPQLSEQDLRRWVQERQRAEPEKDPVATLNKILAFAKEHLGVPTRLGIVRYTDLVSALEMAWQEADQRRQVAPKNKPIRNALRLAASIAKDHLADAVEWRTDRQYAFERQHQHLMLWEFLAEVPEGANA